MEGILGLSIFYGITKNIATFTQKVVKNEIVVIFILTISFIIITTISVFVMIIQGWNGFFNLYTKFNVEGNKEESYFCYLNTLVENPKKLKLLPNKNYSIYYKYEKDSQNQHNKKLVPKIYEYRVPWQLMASIDFVKNMGESTIADKIAYELRPIVLDYDEVDIKTKIVTISKNGTVEKSYNSEEVIIKGISTYYMEANYKYEKYENVPVESWVNRDSKGNIISQSTKYQTVYKIIGEKEQYEKRNHKRLQETLKKHNIKNKSDMDFILMYARNMINGNAIQGLIK